MKLKLIPEKLEDLILPNKEEVITYINKKINMNDLNICFIGNSNCCKSTICNIIINTFLNKHNNYEKKKILFELNYYDDINIQNQINNLQIFCQNNINCNKIVYINNFGDFNEANQQYLKYYIDTFNKLKQKNKIFFLIECKDESLIKDIIKSRVDIYRLHELDNKSYKKILENIVEKKKINITENTKNKILNSYNISIKSILCYLEKLYILDYDENINIHTINYDIFYKYLKHIEKNEINESIKILFELYDNGYDISDIYFYLFEYIKNNNKTEYFNLIEKICYYITQYYSGNYNKVMLILLSYELNNEINNEINNELNK